MIGLRVRHALALSTLAIASIACSPGPSVVVLPPLEALVASGDSQYGTPGQTLQTPLQVVVRAISTQIPQEGTTVLWTVESGDASIVGLSTALTDSTGSSSVRVRLGNGTGEITIRATVENQEQARAQFRVFNVDRPVLDAVSPASAVPGASITLTGSNFSPDPEQNVVLFSGIRGRVSAASSTQLTVTVPECLPARDVAVRVQLGVVGSGALALSVAAGGTVRALQVGETFDATDAGGYSCPTVPGDGSAKYLAIVYSASTVGAASHPFAFTALSATSPLAVHAPGSLRPTIPPLALEPPDAQALWDEHLREREADLTLGRRRPGAIGPQAVDRMDAPPVQGEQRTFQVFRNSGGFTQVTAVAEHVGDRVALFVDRNAPAGGYTKSDLQLFSARFDDVIHPVVTGAFGAVSDLDANQRVVILTTPEVNSLTPKGATGFVGGFFFGLDLLPEREGSNGGEIFYTLVPDPLGVHSDPRPKAALLELVPGILAHEFQHMVHFNERVLVRDAESNEAIWLSESLAQFAEELVAREYSRLGDAAGTELFRDGTRDRSRRYLSGTDSVSLIVSAGQGSLAERGAGLLNMMYLADRFGTDLVGRLTRTTRTGISNVEAETGTQWPDVLSDWWSAVYLDGPGPETGNLVYPGVDLRSFLGNPFPLVPPDLGSGDVSRSGALRSSAAAYYIVSPSAGGSTTLRVAGEAGGVSAPQAAMRMRLIRIE
ncbi:MAG: IPT/TIG domain-containing protein [Gemmatimonadetes bacterium]|nr:IPT/TIG domain-containing protein [Gemmatimonadota bacterium]